MSKHNRSRQLANLQGNATEPQKDAQVAGSTVSEGVETKPRPRVTEFVPRPCAACQALRDMDPEIKGRSCSRVYSTQGRTRYCKCGFCGATWKEVE